MGLKESGSMITNSKTNIVRKSVVAIRRTLLVLISKKVVWFFIPISDLTLYFNNNPKNQHYSSRNVNSIT